jgi:hypothetical protein
MEPNMICECNAELNIQVQIKDGETGQCVSDIHVFRNKLPTIPLYLDSAACRFSLAAGKGSLVLKFAAPGYDTLNLDPISIRQRGNSCCPKYDDKNIFVTWYSTSSGKPAEVSVE